MNKYNDSKSKFKLGFTIVELLVVIVIIGILAGITIVSYVGISNKAIAAGLQSELSGASRKLSLYNVMFEGYPSALDESGCPAAPSTDSDYCVKYSAGTTFTYTSTGPKNYTLTFTKSNISWRVTESLTPFAFSTTQVTGITNITGAVLIGQTLSAGTVTPADATVAYQWKSSSSSNGTYSDVSGATAKTYVITADDAGKYFKVSVTGTGDFAGAILSTATSSPVSIIITAMAAISGTTQVGQTLTAGALTPAGATASYQWQSASTSGGTYTDISGATSNTYVITAGYVGKYFKVSITGTGNYVGNQTSASTTSSAQASITAIAAISGTAQVGQTLTAGALTPAAATVSYQWQSASTSGGTYADISGATSNTYAVTIGYIGKYFKVKVTGTGDYIGSQTSAATSSAVIADANWITIGSQTWAKVNSNVGTMITGATSQTNNAVLEKYCQANTESNCTTYGGLYQWDEAMQYSTTEGAQGICPAGSHIPSDNDWKILEIQLGMTQAQADGTDSRGTNQGTQLKSGGASGLNIPFGGVRNDAGVFANFPSSDAHVWSSTQSGTTAWRRYLHSTLATVLRATDPKAYGFSVRCLAN